MAQQPPQVSPFDGRFLPREIGAALAELEKAEVATAEARKTKRDTEVALRVAEETGAELPAFHLAEKAVSDAGQGVRIAGVAEVKAAEALLAVTEEMRPHTLEVLKAAHDAEDGDLRTTLETLAGVIEKMTARTIDYNFVRKPGGKHHRPAGSGAWSESERMEWAAGRLKLPAGYVELSKAITGVLDPPPPLGQKFGNDGQTGTAAETREANAAKIGEGVRASVRSEARGNFADRQGLTVEQLDAQEAAKGSRVLEGDDALKAIEAEKAKEVAEGMVEPEPDAEQVAERHAEEMGEPDAETEAE